MSQSIPYPRPDGGNSPALEFQAEGETQAPALVVLQEWWGINEHMKSVGQRLSQAGYRVLLPDLFRGQVTQDKAQAQKLMTGLDWADAVHQDLRGAVQFLKQSGQKVGVLGFCMGGALSIATAVHAPECDAAVCFYGIPPAELADPQEVKIPILAHFAKSDDWCTPEAVDQLEAQWKKAQVTYELYRYDAQHAFFNETRPEVFDATSANLAWSRTLEFLGKQLGP